MSASPFAKIADRLRRTLLEAVWSQWRALGLPVTAGGACRAVVDPEALILASLWLEAIEPRLAKVLRLWALSGSRLLSVQRTRNVAARYPPAVAARLKWFAGECAVRGKDARWQALAPRPSRVAEDTEWKKLERVTPALQAPSSLLLRLRLGMGVGIKADVLGYLIGSAGARRTIREITEATVYHRRAVQRSVEDLVAGRFVAAPATSPATFRIHERGWTAALELGRDTPAWRYWHQVFLLGAALDHAAEAAREKSPYLQSSRARDVLEAHRMAFDLNAISMGDPADTPGEGYLEMLADDVERLAERVGENFV